MDTSEQYIKMCEKAEEIQEQFPFDYQDKDGSDLPNVFFSSNSALGVGSFYNPVKAELRDAVWLPRQDQLQEMAFTNITATYNLLPTKVIAFSDYWEEYGFPVWATSLEQLWLAFVMFELYHKKWLGSEWVND